MIELSVVVMGMRGQGRRPFDVRTPSTNLGYSGPAVNGGAGSKGVIRWIIVGGVAIAVAAGGVVYSTRHGPSGSGGAAGGTGGSSQPGAPSNQDTAVVPHNNVAAIYSEFGAVPSERKLIDGFTAYLQSEGYTVNLFVDANEGAGDRGTATLANFAKLADTASVVIVSAHGEDFSGSGQSCSLDTKGLLRCPDPADLSVCDRADDSKGLVVCPAVDPTTNICINPAAGGDKGLFRTDCPPAAAPPATATEPPGSVAASPSSTPTQQPVMQVEWYPTWDAERAAYQQYIALGYDPSWLYDPVTPRGYYLASTLIPWRTSDEYQVDPSTGQPLTNEGLRPWLGVTAAGVAHFFGGKHLDLVDNLSCHSVAMSDSFDARSYLGHGSQACASFESHDDPLLFQRLTGQEGVDRRTTTAAMAAGGYDDRFFQLGGGAKPVVLSPAVGSIIPGAGAKLDPGGTADVHIVFDAAMSTKTTDGVVSATGCGTNVSNAQWKGPDTLDLQLPIPKQPPAGDTTLTLTIHQDKAIAEASTDDNAHLDGNSDPPQKSGLAPNRDDYVLRLSCGTGDNFMVTVASSGHLHSAFTGRNTTASVDFQWQESTTVLLSFHGAVFDGATVQSATLTATGSSVGPAESCTFGASGTKPPVTVNASASATGSGFDHHTIINAPIPINVGSGGSLTASGKCSPNSQRAVQPFSFWNPVPGFDPGGMLSSAELGAMPPLDLDGAVSAPATTPWAIDFTDTDTQGNTDHVTLTGSRTVTVARP